MFKILISKEEGLSKDDEDIDYKELSYKVYRLLDCVKDNLIFGDEDSEGRESVLLEITDECDWIRVFLAPSYERAAPEVQRG